MLEQKLKKLKTQNAFVQHWRVPIVRENPRWQFSLSEDCYIAFPLKSLTFSLSHVCKGTKNTYEEHLQGDARLRMLHIHTALGCSSCSKLHFHVKPLSFSSFSTIGMERFWQTSKPPSGSCFPYFKFEHHHQLQTSQPLLRLLYTPARTSYIIMKHSRTALLGLEHTVPYKTPRRDCFPKSLQSKNARNTPGGEKAGMGR